MNKVNLILEGLHEAGKVDDMEKAMIKEVKKQLKLKKNRKDIRKALGIQFPSVSVEDREDAINQVMGQSDTYNGETEPPAYK